MDIEEWLLAFVCAYATLLFSVRFLARRWAAAKRTERSLSSNASRIQNQIG